MGLVVSDFNRSAVGHYNGLAEGKAKAQPPPPVPPDGRRSPMRTIGAEGPYAV